MKIFFWDLGAIKGSDHIVSGDISCGTQYHFTMETQVMKINETSLPLLSFFN